MDKLNNLLINYGFINLNVEHQHIETYPASEPTQEPQQSDEDGPMEETEDVEITLPEELDTDAARLILNKLVDAEVLDSNYQPVDLTRTDRAVLANVIGSELDISNRWSCFQKLWNVKNIGKDYQRALEMQKTSKLIERYKAIIAN